MKIRIVSDLHLDINSKFNVEIPNNYDFTLIAGDLGGDYKKNAEWIKHNIHMGAFISGNHDAYTYNTPLEDVKEYYHKKFPLKGPVTYFDNDVGVISKELEDGTLLIADVLYTDYELVVTPNMKTMSKKEIVENNMFFATPKINGPYLNDFNFFTRKGKYKKSEYNIFDNRCPKDCYYLKPENYLEHFNNTFQKINDLVEKNKDKNIILMTHHCLSKKCIANKYTDNILNASYISDKDEWIKKHPNIRLIISGHVHDRFNFKIGKTRYITNPLGYLKYCENIQIIKTKNGSKKEFWTPDFFIDTETWRISKIKYNNKEWEKQQTMNLALMSAFI